MGALYDCDDRGVFRSVARQRLSFPAIRRRVSCCARYFVCGGDYRFDMHRVPCVAKAFRLRRGAHSRRLADRLSACVRPDLFRRAVCGARYSCRRGGAEGRVDAVDHAARRGFSV